MNIGLTSEYFFPFAPGGAEWSTLFLAQRLAKAHRVVVITPNYGAAPHEEKDGIIIERFAFPFKLGHGQRLVPYRYLSNPLFYAYSALQIARQVKKHRLDILHAHNKQVLVGTVVAAKATGLPAVVSLRDYMVLCRYGMCLNAFDTHPDGCHLASYRQCVRDYLALYMPDIGAWRRTLVYAGAGYHRLDTMLKRAVLGRADAAVTTSRKMRHIYLSRGLDPLRTLAIHNPLPEAPVLSPPSEGHQSGFHILYAGKLSWGKGPHLLVEALPAIRRAVAPEPVSVTLAGQGPLRAHLEQRVDTLGLADIVTFAGQLPYHMLQRLYVQADVVVVPSVWQEPFGRVALEALMCGTPVVASNRGGLGEIVQDGITGFIVEPKPKPIADAVVHVLQSSTFRLQVRDALPSLRRRFGSDIVRLHMELYNRLLSGRPLELPLPGE